MIRAIILITILHGNQEAGYDVVAAIDGSGTLNKTVREAAISRMIQAGATIMTWFPIMAKLQGDWKNLLLQTW